MEIRVDPLRNDDPDELLEMLRLGEETMTFLSSNVGKKLLSQMEEVRRQAIAELDQMQPGTELSYDLYLKLHLPKLLTVFINQLLSDMDYAEARAQDMMENR